MFGRKCIRCKEKISRGFEFCPHCGMPQKRNKPEDYGLLGKRDIAEDNEDFFNAPITGFSSGILDKMLKGTVKMLQRELEKGMKPSENNKEKMNFPKSRLQIYINGKKVNMSELNETLTGKPLSQEQKNQSKPLPSPSEELILKSSKLPRKEAKTSLKRISNKVIYEIELPGISSIENVLITKLEEGVGVKAFTKDIVWVKVLPIKLKLLNYYLENKSLFLEFQGR